MLLFSLVPFATTSTPSVSAQSRPRARLLTQLLDEHTDAECLDVLRRVHMISETTSAEGASEPSSRHSSRPPSIRREASGDNSETSSTNFTDVDQKTTVSLTSKVSAGGANFSQGE